MTREMPRGGEEYARERCERGGGGLQKKKKIRHPQMMLTAVHHVALVRGEWTETRKGECSSHLLRARKGLIGICERHVSRVTMSVLVSE